MLHHLKRYGLLLAILTVFSACGGGGGGGGGGGAASTGAITPPSVIFTIPSSYQNGVALNSAISVTFDMAMNAATITTTTFTLAGQAGPVPGTVTYSGRTATFTPLAPLTANTTYRATITTGARSQAEIPLQANVTWKFTTGTATDNANPTITPNSPANGDVGIALNTRVSAAFSEPMLADSITTATFTLKNGIVQVPGSVSFDGAKTATFSPSSPLLPGVTYTASVTGVKDLAGNLLGGIFAWNFTTGGAADVTPPGITANSPAASALNVPVTSIITATFSEKMDPATVNLLTFTLNSAAGSFPGAITYDVLTRTATFTPDSQLKGNTIYTATVSTGATDMAGNALPSNSTWAFTTGADATPPTVTSVTPAAGAVNIPSVNPTIAATFSEAMNPVTINNATFTLEIQIAPGVFNPVGGTITLNGRTAELVPPGVNLAPASTYRATITTGVQDLAGNPLPVNFTWGFTTQ